MAILFEMTEEFRENLENQGVVFEGSYKDATNLYKLDVSREYDVTLKDAKKALKDKKYDEALKLFKKCKSLLPKIKAEVAKIPDDKGFDIFMGIIGSTGVSLSGQFKDKKTGNRAYYRKWWESQVINMNAYLDKQIEDLQGLKESFDEIIDIDTDFDM